MRDRRYGIFKEIYADFFQWLKLLEPVTYKVTRRYLYAVWMSGGYEALTSTDYYGLYRQDVYFSLWLND